MEAVVADVKWMEVEEDEDDVNPCKYLEIWHTNDTNVALQFSNKVHIHRRCHWNHCSTARNETARYNTVEFPPRLQ